MISGESRLGGQVNLGKHLLLLFEQLLILARLDHATAHEIVIVTAGLVGEELVGGQVQQVYRVVALILGHLSKHIVLAGEERGCRLATSIVGGLLLESRLMLLTC